MMRRRSAAAAAAALAAALPSSSSSSSLTPARRRCFSATPRRPAHCCYGQPADGCPAIQSITGAAVSDADLRRRIVALEAAVLERDAVIADMIRAAAAPADCQEVTTSDVLLSVLTAAEGPARVRIPSDTVIELTNRVPVRLPPKRHVEIFGDGSSVVVGNILVPAGASFTATSVRFQALSREIPTIEVTSNAAAALRHCTVAGGRDGVYLCSGATASLVKCCIEDNVRGVFESLRCQLSAIDCEFIDNTFHAVLLGNGGRAPATAATAATAAGAAGVKKGSRSPQESLAVALRLYQAGHRFSGDGARADVALSYNPILDQYGDAFRGGVPRELSGADATANLVDPAW